MKQSSLTQLYREHQRDLLAAALNCAADGPDDVVSFLAVRLADKWGLKGNDRAEFFTSIGLHGSGRPRGAALKVTP